MKYQIKSYDANNHTVHVAIAEDDEDIDVAQVYAITTLFKYTSNELVDHISEIWLNAAFEKRARMTLSKTLLNYISENIGVVKILSDPDDIQGSQSTAVDSSGTTNIEVL
jgi:hypothetical protein